ncbi:hypothetical protein MSAN_01604600 [Mycena sanguinolenta]|uniref:Cell wall galactomannoprotein n=1 Tax=Mycena sanguinolenta TaxID=230812 RepID=A0A8H7CV76_9AGAR|nr:hypothetical protein MSAN_01604600 [Mycena sanguinolenta]
MVRIFSVVVSLFVAICATAAPMQRRQTGDLDCNLARLKIIFDVAGTQQLVSQINATDLDTASAVAVAQTGLQSVNSAIQVILAAIFSGQTAPASFRDQVEAGLNLANFALGNITDPSLNSTVTAARTRLLTAGADGDMVVAACK